MSPRLTAMMLTGLALLGGSGATAPTAAGQPSNAASEPAVALDGPGRLTVRAAGVPLPALLARVEAATGVSIAALGSLSRRGPITLAAGPAPVEHVLRQIVYPDRVTTAYRMTGRTAALARLVIVPDPVASGPAPASTPPETARAEGAWWRLEDLTSGVHPTRRRTAVLALGTALEDGGAVALLEAVVRGDTGLAPRDPARELARRVLDARAGAD